MSFAAKSSTLLLIALFAFAASGCSHDSDPHEKLNVPGYYNGPMQPKGGAKAPAAAPAPGPDKGG